MGDILHALPTVTALRAVLPAGFIGWAVEPQWEPLLCAGSAAQPPVRGPEMPVVDILHRVPAKRWARSPVAPSTWREIAKVRRDLRARHYDVCLDLQGAVRSAWIGRMAASPRLIGEAQPREPMARWLFDEKVETKGAHVIEQAYEVTGSVLGAELPKHAAALPVDPIAERWCQSWLAERQIGRFAVVNPGAGWGAKRWPVERYAAVAVQLGRLGVATVVNVGPGESELADTVCAGAAGYAFSMSGGIGPLIECMRRASLFIGGDTGPLHLAAALQRPVVGIYGPTDPARNGPYATRARVLRHPASKRDHARRSEPETGLLTITVEDVLAAAQELLKEPFNLA